MNARLALPLQVALEEMGHKQPATELITDNNTAEGILNGKIKQNRSKGIDMRYYWLRDRVSQGQFIVNWKPGSVNLADYFTKHHPASHHKALRAIYLFDTNNKLDLQGCIKILSDRATGKKHEHKVNKGNKSVMKTSHKQVTIVSKSAMCVARLKAQSCASAA